MTSRVVAAFDFDGTLAPGDSLVPFLRRVVPRARLARGVTAAWLDLLQVPRGGVYRDRAKAALLARVLPGIPADRFESACNAYAEVLVTRLRPDVLARARWHSDEGHDVVIVSASPEHYLTPLAARLGFRAALATRLEIADGVLTGRLIGANVRGEEKVRRLVDWIAGDACELWAYGDSAGDDELLALADHPTRVGRARLVTPPPPPS